MIKFAVRSMIARPWMSLVSATALLSVGSTAGVISAVAQTAQASFVGDADRAWITPYDLLVRPAGSETHLEASEGLVRPNFMAGINGGISREELTAISSIAGVEVAAPLATVGFVNQESLWSVVIPGDTDGVYRVTVDSNGDNGESHYEVDRRYLFVAPAGKFTDIDLFTLKGTMQTDDGTVECRSDRQCFGRDLCLDPSCSTTQPIFPGLSAGDASYYLYVTQPLIIAGIDPVAEARLVGLDRCMSTGRYISPADAPRDLGSGDDLEQIPVIMSSHSFVDETMTLAADKADAGLNQVAGGADPAQLGSWRELSRSQRSVDDLYQSFIANQSVRGQEWVDPFPIWTAADVAYNEIGQRRLQPIETSINLDVYRRLQGGVGSGGTDVLIPPAARDRAFRGIDVHADGYVMGPGSAYRLKKFQILGTYDSTCIPGWDPLAGGRLDAYNFPEVRLENGQTLTPTRSLSGYINSPPMVLTTLDSAAWLSDPERYQGQPGNRFISVVRVRVAGTDHPGAESQARLARVALEIRQRTGLAVDIVKGASATDVQVELPAGRFGRPAHVATEGWWAKGVVIRFIRAIDSQAIALIGLAFVAATLFVATIWYTSMRRRRSELATLRAIGWPAARIALVVALDGVIIGLIAAAGLLATGFVLDRLSIFASSGAFIFAAVTTFTAALIAGLVPAFAAGKGGTAGAMRGAGAIRRVGAPRSLFDLAIRELTVQSRIESGIAIGMIAVGTFLMGLVTLVATAFDGQLDLTILGQHIGAKAAPYHFLVVGLVIALASFENGQLLMLSYAERRGQLSTLRALGWHHRALLRLLAWQGAALVTAGTGLGSAAIIVVGMFSDAAVAPLLVATAIGAATALVAASVGLGAVLWTVGKDSPIDGLREP